MNRHLFFIITACVVTGITPLVFSERNNMLTFALVALAALFIQVYWRDVVVQLLIIRGVYANKAGDHQKLKNSYLQIYKLMPHSFAGKMAMGVICSLENNWARAESFFRQALYLRPGNIYVSLNLSVVLLKRERYQEAVKLLSMLLFAYPRSVMAYKILAEAYYRLGELYNARNCLLAARFIHRHDPEIEGFLKTLEEEIKEVA
ncbi:tetratricopeptide repeat protein [Desulfallas thermosapovorans]|uniref:Tetratricopeptide repeat protein n=1 Tax=Desulfallas thermosapovorans DSM 6562 TaxID=1121431 RepID=A0A5S4ZPX8_9FIRM|nr:tetratricopeptide repeat protein [Desulfallas thermosapovorans]TYO94721.1 tetratricopeptide repeat protein [Desulfallas thermosapovorans DSM 6562]